MPQGLDTTSPLTTMKPGFVRQAKNWNLGFEGGYTKRSGYVNELATPYGSNKITQGIEYHNSAGTTQVILFGTDGTSTGGEYGYINAGAVTNISTGLSGTERPYFAQFDDRLFFYNGVDDPQLYDGTSTRQVGIDAPTNAPTIVSQSTGGNLSLLSAYVFAYTYFNSVTGAESSPSPGASVTLTGSNDEVNLGLTAGNSATADTIRVYRTSGNGNTLFLDGTTTISSTTYSSTVADAGLGQQIQLDNTRITDLSATAKFPIISENRIFLVTDVNEVRFSKLGQNGPMPESFEVKSVASTLGRHGNNDQIVGLNKITALPIVLKERSVGRLDPFGLPDISQSIDNVGYNYREISDTVGAVCHGGAVQVLDELIFVSKDNIYATNGTTVRQVGSAIQATIRSLGFSSTQRPFISAINDANFRRVYFQVFSAPSQSKPDLTIVGDYQQYPNFRWTTYEKGSDPSVRPGIIAASFFEVTNVTSGLKDIWFGNNNSNGKVYKMNSGDSDDSLAIDAHMVTRPYFASQPIFWKLYKKTEFTALGNGENYSLTVCGIYDLSDVEEECLPLSLLSLGYRWDDPTSLWDTAVWADETATKLEYFMHRKAKYLQLSIKQQDANAPVQLFSWGTYESLFSPMEGPR